MTITVTVEELRAYEEAMRKWHGERSQLIETLLKNAPIYVDHSSFSSHRAGNVDEKLSTAIADWERTNPKPTLLPRV